MACLVAPSFYEGSGTVIDSLGTNNGTNNGATNITGILNSAYDFELSESDYIETGSNLGISGADSRTFNFWIKRESQVANHLIGIGSGWEDEFKLRINYIIKKKNKNKK